MRKIVLPIILAGMLVSCGPTSEPTVVPPSEDPTVTNPSTDPSVPTQPSTPNPYDITIDVPDLGVELTNLIDAKTKGKGDYLYVYGIVAQVTYGFDTTLGQDVETGFYLVDNTSSMYIYKGYTEVKNLTIGDAVLVNGEIDYFISQQEAGAGSEIGYLGAQQIKADNVEIIDNNYNDIPTVGIEKTTIKELSTTNFRDRDLSGTIFKVNATVTHSNVSGTDVYYFNDPSMDYSVYTYSSISGREFSWIKDYVNTTYEWTIAIHSLRSKDEAWRIIPIESFLEVTISDDDVAGYALDRLAKQFNPTYNSTTSISLRSADEKLADTTVSYTSSSNAHSISVDNENNVSLNIDSTVLGEFTVTITLEYKGKTYQRVVTIEVIEKPSFDGITAAELQTVADGEVVKVKGIYVRTAANCTGIYLTDETGVMVVYYTAAFDPSNYIVGEELIFEGTVLTDFTDGGTKPGYKRLQNAVLVSNDSVVHEWNTDLCEGELTVSELSVANLDRVSKIYKVYGSVKTNNPGYYSNKLLCDGNDSSITISLYCSSASQLSWLDPYEEEVKNYYVIIRDIKGTKPRVEILDFEK